MSPVGPMLCERGVPCAQCKAKQKSARVQQQYTSLRTARQRPMNACERGGGPVGNWHATGQRAVSRVNNRRQRSVSGEACSRAVGKVTRSQRTSEVRSQKQSVCGHSE
ncbi:hypothetical protein T03_13915 [Trichinella britovi]|uniref:Uncharacterized protein n=1 Tax=Trichinella britovi TaxID=45882 RepID=A0A0V1CEF1_TRIBR|nr:hypothetical protein T03_13915 [Trichinella britovi]